MASVVRAAGNDFPWPGSRRRAPAPTPPHPAARRRLQAAAPAPSRAPAPSSFSSFPSSRFSLFLPLTLLFVNRPPPRSSMTAPSSLSFGSSRARRPSPCSVDNALDQEPPGARTSLNPLLRLTCVQPQVDHDAARRPFVARDRQIRSCRNGSSRPRHPRPSPVGCSVAITFASPVLLLLCSPGPRLESGDAPLAAALFCCCPSPSTTEHEIYAKYPFMDVAKYNYHRHVPLRAGFAKYNDAQVPLRMTSDAYKRVPLLPLPSSWARQDRRVNDYFATTRVPLPPISN